MPFRLRHTFAFLSLATFVPIAGRAAEENAATEITTLETFVVRETSRSAVPGFSPLAASLDGLFQPGASVLEIPRSISVLTPATLAAQNIYSLDSLEKAGPGTQRINYFGVAGVPILRGTEGGVYLDGMLRAYQRNEMPVSFGSLDRLDIVRGSAPAHFAPTPVGGFVNFIPKAPFFKKRSQLEIRVASWDKIYGQLDFGAPFLFGEKQKPGAYRVSVSAQRAGSYYDNYRNDFDSVYGTTKLQLTPKLSLTLGSEFYDYRSNEMVGWNRPTTELIRDGRYIIGEPADLTSPAWGGTVARTLLEFPLTQFVNPSLHAVAIPGDIARAQISPSLRALMIDLNDSGQRASLYTLRPDSQIPSFLQANPTLFAQRKTTAQAALDSLSKPAQDAFVYTQAYFDAGGQVLTTQLDGSQVLADSGDFADALNGIFFANLARAEINGIAWKNQFFAEVISTEKRSSYGFAAETAQSVFADKFTIEHALPEQKLRIVYGAELRATFARMQQDFAAEPFTRRDLSRTSISPNTVMRAGDQLGADGLNLWTPNTGANIQSQLYEAAVFATTEHQTTRRLTTNFSARFHLAGYKTRLPDGVDRASPTVIASAKTDGGKGFVLLAVNPVFKLTDKLNLYATAQSGTAIDPAFGGPVYSSGNFADAELYELGLKAALFERTLFASVACYRWNQTNFNTRDSRAEPLRGEGVEFETTWQPRPQLALTASFTAQRQYYRGASLGFGATYLTPQQIALQGGYFNAAGNRTFANNPELRYAGYPEMTARIFTTYEFFPNWNASAGLTWRDAFWHNFDHTLRLPSAVVWDFSAGWKSKRFELRVSVENAFDADYFTGAPPIFGANALLTKATPAEYALSAKWHF